MIEVSISEVLLGSKSKILLGCSQSRLLSLCTGQLLPDFLQRRAVARCDEGRLGQRLAERN
jgi:hypothetical protein